MASFAPENQAPPSYPYFWQQRTQEPRPDESGSIIAKGVSEAIHGGTQFVNAAFEKGIQNDIYAQVDPIRDEYMAQLHTADQALREGQTAIDPVGKHPEDVKNLPQTLDKFNSAKANGKLSQTDYDARLNSLAKDIRAKYPGYREYVDQVFQRATGRDSANQYIRSVLGDINSFEDAKKEHLTKIENLALTEGMKFDGGAGWYRKLKESGNDPKVEDRFLKWLNDARSQETDLERTNKKLEVLEKVDRLGTKEAKDAANEGATLTGAGFWSHRWDFMYEQTGMVTDEYQQAVNDARHGKMPSLSSENSAKIASHMDIERGSWIAARASQLSKVYKDPDELTKVVENEAKLYFDPIANAFKDEKWGVANANKKVIEGKAVDKYQTVVSDPQFKNYLEMTQGFHIMNPALSSVMATQMATLPPLIASKYAVDMTSIANPDPSKGRTPKEVFEEAQAKNIQKTDYYKHAIDFLSKVGDKTPENEYSDALIDHMFSDRNIGFIGMFDKDHYVYKGSKPTLVPGQETILDQLTSQSMVNKVWERSVAGKHGNHPEYWTNMKNWAVNEASSSILSDPRFSKDMSSEYMFGPSIESLSEEKQPVPELRYSTTNNKFHVPPDNTYGNRVVDTERLTSDVMRFNKTIAGLTRIWEKEHGDVDVNLYTLLDSLHPEPNSLVGQMMKAIEAAHPDDRK